MVPTTVGYFGLNDPFYLHVNVIKCNIVQHPPEPTVIFMNIQWKCEFLNQRSLKTVPSLNITVELQ